LSRIVNPPRKNQEQQWQRTQAVGAGIDQQRSATSDCSGVSAGERTAEAEGRREESGHNQKLGVIHKETSKMLKTITFQNGQLEREGTIIAANLTGSARITRGNFDNDWDGQFSFEGSLDSGDTALLVIPGVLAGLIHLDRLKNSICNFSGAGAPDINESIT
jgi:hypothetical protein